MSDENTNGENSTENEGAAMPAEGGAEAPAEAPAEATPEAAPAEGGDNAPASE